MEAPSQGSKDADTSPNAAIEHWPQAQAQSFGWRAERKTAVQEPPLRLRWLEDGDAPKRHGQALEPIALRLKLTLDKNSMLRRLA